MRNTIPIGGAVLGWLLLAAGNGALAQDWPQWRGPNRDAKVEGFKAPQAWPKELNQKWKVTVGGGDASPALVGDKLYVFSREDPNEVIRCLDATTGKEVWQDKYESQHEHEGNCLRKTARMTRERQRLEFPKTRKNICSLLPSNHERSKQRKCKKPDTVMQHL